MLLLLFLFVKFVSTKFSLEFVELEYLEFSLSGCGKHFANMNLDIVLL